MSSRRKTGVLVVSGLVGILVAASASVALARPSSHAQQVRKAQRNQTWVSAFSNPHWVYYPWCSCWAQEGDIEWDSIGVNPVNLNNSPMKISPPVSVGPRGFFPTTIDVESYGNNKLAEVNVYSLSSDGKSATLVKELVAPAGADGASLSVATDSVGTPAQMITFSRRGAALNGGSGKFPLSYGVDFVVKRRALGCSNRYISPPILLETNLVDSKSKHALGRAVPMPCSSSYPNQILIKK